MFIYSKLYKHLFCSVCSSQSEAFQLPISPSLSLSQILHFLTILGLAIYVVHFTGSFCIEGGWVYMCMYTCSGLGISVARYLHFFFIFMFLLKKMQ